MPVYEYRCKECGKTHEIEHGFHDARPTSCPSCGGHLVRVFHPVGVVFKGSGFHKTDYTSSGARKEAGAQAASGASEAVKADGKAPGPAPAAKMEKKSESGSKPATKGGTETKSSSGDAKR